jgi:hypothetical protein
MKQHRKKIGDIINSCQTTDQLAVAGRLVTNLLIYDKDEFKIGLILLEIKALEMRLTKVLDHMDKLCFIQSI